MQDAQARDRVHSARSPRVVSLRTPVTRAAFTMVLWLCYLAARSGVNLCGSIRSHLAVALPYFRKSAPRTCGSLDKNQMALYNTGGEVNSFPCCHSRRTTGL